MPGGFNLKPLPARVLLTTAMTAGSDGAPGPQGISNYDLFPTPDKFAGQSGHSNGHALGIARVNNWFYGLADEFFRHILYYTPADKLFKNLSV